MTTAHRPTWKPAVGGVKNHGFVSQQTSAKDQIGMQTLKFRQIGQSHPEEMSRRNVLDELEQREYEQLSEKNKAILQIESEEKKVDSIALLKNHAETATESSKFDDSDAEFDDRDNEFDSSRYVASFSLISFTGLSSIVARRKTMKTMMMSSHFSGSWIKLKLKEH
jgi:hypothetical protein